MIPYVYLLVAATTMTTTNSNGNNSCVSFQHKSELHRCVCVSVSSIRIYRIISMFNL